MGIELLPSSALLLDTILNNSSAQTSTNGVQAPRIQQTPASARADNRSSYNQPQQRNAVVLPPSNVVDVVTPSLPTLGIPSGYQSAVRGAVSGTIATVLQTSQAQNGDTDINSNQYRGNVATRLFSGIRGFVASTAPAFGVDANAGPLSSGLAVLANSAINIGKHSVVQKYGTAILNAQQYAVFGTAVLNSFNLKFNDLPEVKQVESIKSATNVVGPASSAEATQQAAESTQRGIRLSPPPYQSDGSVTNNSIGDEGLPNPHTYKVYLESSLNASELFLFKTQPVISITETAQYSEFSPMHAPAHVLAYKNSPSRTFSVSDVKLVSRNASEAQHNLQMLTLLRSWTKPYFGRSLANQPSNTDYADEPTAESVRINSQASTRNSRQGARGVTGELAAKAAAASEVSNLLRKHPAPVPIEYIAGAINTYDPMNGTILPNDSAPTTAAASSRTAASVAAKARTDFAIIDPRLVNFSNDDAAKARTDFAIIDPRLVNFSNAGAGRGVLGGPTAAELTQTTPITPSAATANTPGNETLKSSIGSPPEVLYFYGYSEDGITATNTVQNIRRVPVVIASVAFSYPNDVDYIPTLDGVPFPTVMNITLELKETKAPYEIEQFSLADFKAGKLIGW